MQLHQASFIKDTYQGLRDRQANFSKDTRDSFKTGSDLLGRCFLSARGDASFEAALTF